MPSREKSCSGTLALKKGSQRIFITEANRNITSCRPETENNKICTKRRVHHAPSYTLPILSYPICSDLTASLPRVKLIYTFLCPSLSPFLLPKHNKKTTRYLASLRSLAIEQAIKAQCKHKRNTSGPVRPSFPQTNAIMQKW